MSAVQESTRINSHGEALVPTVAAAISLPIVLFSLMGYDINPAFLLAPLIGMAFLKSFGRTTVAYMSAMTLGLVSIFVANTLLPDGELVRHILSLVLIMFAPSFLFLGKYVSKKHGVDKAFYWLSVFSALFLIVVTVRIFMLDQAVRIYIGPLGLAAMNAEFFGLPVFASFGVLSLAHLICLQAMVLCGAFIAGKASKPMLALFWIALFCASFLIIGSDSRSAQVLLAWILGTIVVYAWRHAGARRVCGVAILAILMAFAVSYFRGISESRLVTSIEAFSGDEAPAVKEGKSAPKEWEKQADQFATGRIELIVAGLKEVSVSPVIGNGFGSYGRYGDSANEQSKGLKANSSTHVYYLTLLWKGGVIFFIPFIAMILLNLRAAVIGTKATEGSAERFFAWAAVLMAFGPMALAWDILIVPSAGALAFFLFGLLGGLKNRAAVIQAIT
ncbi:O-antigen ligase family protein [Pseudomonas sp. Z3-8]|uniref:O-antigen ligase family protein n=1 Tax=Pseudomonas sp. Z3-8 TaxID=2817412 RepID=UPI003DA8D526